MRPTIALYGVLVAALLAGCSSPPKLKVPSGEWEDFNPAVSPYTLKQPAAKVNNNGQQ